MITLRDILKLINFRRIEPELIGMYHDNSDTVRVYMDHDSWFEFGIHDFADEGTRDGRVEKILTKEVLDSEVTSINRVDELPITAVYIKSV
jgi:hypothetical protein